jgi:hypothetical protein
MINIVIFSKDRACQLELFIRSMKIFFIEHMLCKVFILYTYSNEEFKKGYDRTISYHPEFKYVPEDGSGFKKQLIEILDASVHATMFLVDDIVFKDYFFIRSPEMRTFMSRDDIACLSLRMCPRINYCYTEKRLTPPPVISNEGIWNWVGQPGDWGYPNSLDSCVYKTSQIIDLIRSMNYWNPNTFEGSWANHPPLNRPYMICFKESKIINNPANRVQTANNNHCGNISAGFLNTQYLNEHLIALRPFVGLKNMAAHQEVDILFTKSTQYSIAELLNLVHSNKIDYPKILSNCIYIKRMERADINLYIPIKNRMPFIEPCIRYLKEAIKLSPYSVKIVIIENNHTPDSFNKIEALGLDYVFIPLEISQSENMFAKSLAYNIGYLLSEPTKWNIFHDLDILIGPDYFNKLKVYLDKNPRWVQPYTMRRVLRLSEEYTNKICSGNYVDLEKIPGGHVEASNPGSPGGSIVIRSDVFEEVGGYDPELFFGYAPEDDFLWTKLEASTNKLDIINSCFATGGVFANDPAIEVCHMFHMSVENENTRYRDMLGYRLSYYRYQHPDKIAFINKKREIFKGAKR